MHPTPLSRTSSSASISSSDDAGVSNDAQSVSRRTRKRFTNVQLTILEDAFHQNSHPSREERDALAKLGGMFVPHFVSNVCFDTNTNIFLRLREIKSVTIWFQNKRQTERKVALNNAEHNHSQPLSSPVTTDSTSSRPSLDSIASRSELRTSSPRTPTRNSNPNASIWDNMPPSPVARPISPSLREYADFSKSQRSKRTLEWACAAARLHDKNGGKSSRRRRERKGKENIELTDEDIEEVITPPSTLAGGDTRWTAKPDGRLVAYPQGTQDDDVMKAALTLCGLGRHLLRQG